MEKGTREMKPFLIILKYNGYSKTTIINHVDAGSALALAYKKFPDVLKCRIIK